MQFEPAHGTLPIVVYGRPEVRNNQAVARGRAAVNNAGPTAHAYLDAVNGQISERYDKKTGPQPYPTEVGRVIKIFLAVVAEGK